MLPTWALYQVIHRSLLSLTFYISRIQTAFCIFIFFLLWHVYVQLNFFMCNCIVGALHIRMFTATAQKMYNKKQIQERECEYIELVSEMEILKRLTIFPSNWYYWCLKEVSEKKSCRNSSRNLGRVNK